MVLHAAVSRPLGVAKFVIFASSQVISNGTAPIVGHHQSAMHVTRRDTLTEIAGRETEKGHPVQAMGVPRCIRPIQSC